MWVISRGLYIARARFVFHLGLAVLAFGLFLFVSVFLGLIIVKRDVLQSYFFCHCYMIVKGKV